MSKFHLGFRQLPDERDMRFPLSAAMKAVATTPVSKVWKPGPVNDQSSKNTKNGCVGYSTFKLLTSEPVVIPPPIPITEEEIYLESRRNDEFSGEADEGTSVRAGMETLKRHGLISAYYNGRDWQESVEYMLTTGPLILGIPWYQQMFDPDANGVITIGGSIAGGHAIFCYAADWDNKFITLRGSWSTDWGRDGDCLLSFQDFDRLLKDGGVCVSCTEPINQPA